MKMKLLLVVVFLYYVELYIFDEFILGFDFLVRNELLEII